MPGAKQLVPGFFDHCPLHTGIASNPRADLYSPDPLPDRPPRPEGRGPARVQVADAPLQAAPPAPLHAPLLAPVQHPRRRRPRILRGTPRLSVVIVNYCQWENTAALVREL